MNKNLTQINYWSFIGLMALYLLSPRSEAQTFTIVHVSGKMADELGNTIQKGSQLIAASKIQFLSEEVIAAAIDESHEPFVIRSDYVESVDSPIVDPSTYSLSEVIRPVNGRISTRNSKLRTKVDLISYFGQRKLVFVQNPEEVMISNDYYPQDQYNFFFLRYDYNGETINKKMTANGSSLIWNQEEIFKVDGQSINLKETSAHALYYVKGEVVEMITELDFMFLAPQTLQSMNQAISIELTNEQRTDILLEWIGKLYGKANPKTIDQLINH